MKKQITFVFIPLFLHFLIPSSLHSQSPQGIPYQAVMRNADGSVMASSAVNMTFMIHDGTANGTVVYQESHALTSNAQGLVSCVVGNGVVSQGNFININWGSGAKFLHVMMGTTDLGTQQMLSVPYALYADELPSRVSAEGDTLWVGNEFVIVPGISAANSSYLYAQGIGVMDIDGNFYPSFIINGQEWMQKNLAVSKYRNGDPIPTGLDDATWSVTTIGAYAIYNNEIANNTLYGKLYNWYAVNDSRGLCPTGWHVPSDTEWNIFIANLGGDEVAGGKMKAITGWNSPNTGGTNESGFTGHAGGERSAYSSYVNMGNAGDWWSGTDFFEYNLNNSTFPWFIELYSYDSVVNVLNLAKNNGLSVRCLKDSEIAPIQGCTDGAACNFMANANQDDGSCLYQNATCDDGNVNTINDVINVSCQCAGTVLAIGQDYQGGKIAYIFQPGENGYVSGEIHGIIVSNADVANTFRWACTVTDVPGASGNGVGAGLQNTMDIVNGVTACETAALAAYGFTLNGFNDWVLPSISELSVIYENRSFFGTFPNVWYWSSTEVNAYFAYRFGFSDSNTLQMGASTFGKESFSGVRPVRYF